MKRIYLILLILATIATIANAQFECSLKISDGLSDTILRAKIEQNCSQLLTELGYAFAEMRTPDFDSISIKNEAKDVILQIWNLTSPFNSSVSEIERKIVKNQDGWQIRDISIFMPAAEKEKQKQSIIINLTGNGIIDYIYMIPSNQDISSILTAGQSVKEFSRRQKILNFVEQFRTAYNTKDLSFINNVFSDDALIISGVVVKVVKSDNSINIPDEKIIYTKQNKVQYLRKLKSIFESNKYINIAFEYGDNPVVQHPKHKDLYGVTFKQYWNTSNYKDVGYIFLMIDFEDEENPIIHVRTWQPDEYNGKELSREEIFSVTSFNIVK